MLGGQPGISGYVNPADSTGTAAIGPFFTAGNRMQINTIGATEGTVILQSPVDSIPTGDSHIIYQMTPSGTSVSINGISQVMSVFSGTNNQKTFPANTFDNVAIGAIITVIDGRYYNGIMFDIRIYNRLLNAAEIMDIYQYPNAMFEFNHLSSFLPIPAPEGIQIFRRRMEGY